MTYHPHATLRDFLRDYLLMIDPFIHPVTHEALYPAAAIERAADSPWRLCMPMRDDEWMQVAVPVPLEDGSLEPVMGPAVTGVLQRRLSDRDARTMILKDPWDGMILVPSKSHDDEDRLDALEKASRIYAMGLAACDRLH